MSIEDGMPSTFQNTVGSTQKSAAGQRKERYKVHAQGARTWRHRLLLPVSHGVGLAAACPFSGSALHLLSEFSHLLSVLVLVLVALLTVYFLLFIWQLRPLQRGYLREHSL